MEKNSKTKEKTKYKIPLAGSLGLFATGHKGLRAWREVRDAKKNKSTE